MKNRKVTISLGMFIVTILVAILVNVNTIVGYKSVIDDLTSKIEAMRGDVELAPCPICNKEVKITQVGDTFYIECDEWLEADGCGLTTGYYKSKAELIEDWNSSLSEENK